MCTCCCSGNSLTGRLGSLPPGMWQLDVADNDLTGPLPALGGLAGLEMLVVNNNPRLGGALPGGLEAGCCVSRHYL
jgi:hypothetical protein